MTPVSRRFRGAVVVSTLLVASQTLLVTSNLSATSVSSCEALKRWARAYVGASPTLDELARFDRPHRAAIFGTIAPAARVDIVREQLRRYSELPDMSQAQRVLIAEAIELTTPALYRQDPTAMAAARAFKARADHMFTTPGNSPWFALGAAMRPTPAAAMLPTLAPQRPAALGNADWCECNTEVNDCPGILSCADVGCDAWVACVPPFFNEMCNGACVPLKR